MLARLVVLPEPVGPVTSSRPRGRMMSRRITSGMPICSKDMNSLGMRRSTMPMLPRCLKTATRKRTPLTNSMAKSVPPFSWSSCWQRSGVMLFIKPVVSSLSSTLVSMSRRWPPFFKHRFAADRDEEIARLGLDDSMQEFVDLNGSSHSFTQSTRGDEPSVPSDDEIPSLRARGTFAPSVYYFGSVE